MAWGRGGNDAGEGAGFDEQWAAGAPQRELSASERRLEAERAAAAERAARLRAEQAAGIEEGRRQQRRRARAESGGRRDGRRRAAARTAAQPLTSLAPPTSLAGAVSPPASVGTSPTTTPALTTTTISLEPRGYLPGDCVTWNQTAGGDLSDRPTNVVSCAGPHLVEVAAAKEQITGFSSAWPGEQALNDYTDAKCAPEAAIFLGRPLDPVGRFAANAFSPTEQGWLDGDRDMQCDIASNAPGTWTGTGAPPAAGAVTSQTDAQLTPFTGEVRGVDQSLLYPVGSCLVSGSGYLIPCTAPHTFEIAGTVDITGRASTLPASNAQWESLVGTSCGQAALADLGGSYPSGVRAGWMPIEAPSWAAGRRAVQCIVGKPDASGNWSSYTGLLSHSPAG